MKEGLYGPFFVSVTLSFMTRMDEVAKPHITLPRPALYYYFCAKVLICRTVLKVC